MLVDVPPPAFFQVLVQRGDVLFRVGDAAQAENGHDAINATLVEAAIPLGRVTQLLDAEGNDLVGAFQTSFADFAAQRSVRRRVGFDAVDFRDAFSFARLTGLGSPPRRRGGITFPASASSYPAGFGYGVNPHSRTGADLHDNSLDGRAGWLPGGCDYALANPSLEKGHDVVRVAFTDQWAHDGPEAAEPRGSEARWGEDGGQVPAAHGGENSTREVRERESHKEDGLHEEPDGF